MATVSVLYPKGVEFNMEYYKSTHMPLVQKKWASHGLKSWKVLQFGDDAPYKVQAILEWDSLGEFQSAGESADGKEVLGDIPNFCNKDPVIIAGELVISS